jgi:hypothetical protein
VFIEQNMAILDKVFTQLTAAQAAAYREVQVRAYEALYLRSAIYNFELGNVAEGRAYLQQVAQVNPTVVENGRAFSRRVADEGFRISTEQEDFSAGLAFMDRVFTHLPESLHVLRHYQAQALADLHMAAAFTAFEQRRRGATLKHVTAALGAYPPCAGNLGLLSIGVRSALPWRGRRIEHGNR